jgi:chromosome segregation ATPase
MITKPNKSDDTRLLVEQARAFSSQFSALMQVAAMLDQVGSLRDELEALTVERDRAKHELDILWGQRDTELAALTERIETGLRAKYDEAERVVAREADARRSLADLSEELQDRWRKLTAMEAQLMRTEAAYGDLSTRLSALRGSIPA